MRGSLIGRLGTGVEETSGEPDEGGPENYKGEENHQSKKVKLTEAQESIITEKLYSAAPSLRRGSSQWMAPHVLFRRFLSPS